MFFFIPTNEIFYHLLRPFHLIGIGNLPTDHLILHELQGETPVSWITLQMLVVPVITWISEITRNFMLMKKNYRTGEGNKCFIEEVSIQAEISPLSWMSSAVSERIRGVLNINEKNSRKWSRRNERKQFVHKSYTFIEQKKERCLLDLAEL